MFHAQLGWFCSRDPVGYRTGMNLDEYGNSNSIVSADPTGSVPAGVKDACCDAHDLNQPKLTCYAICKMARERVKHPCSFPELDPNHPEGGVMCIWFWDMNPLNDSGGDLLRKDKVSMRI